jgi:hypothetical protein
MNRMFGFYGTPTAACSGLAIVASTAARAGKSLPRTIVAHRSKLLPGDRSRAPEAVLR